MSKITLVLVIAVLFFASCLPGMDRLPNMVMGLPNALSSPGIQNRSHGEIGIRTFYILPGLDVKIDVTNNIQILGLYYPERPILQLIEGGIKIRIGPQGNEKGLNIFDIGGGSYLISSTYNDNAYYIYQGWEPWIRSYKHFSMIVPLRLYEFTGRSHINPGIDRLKTERFMGLDLIPEVDFSADWEWVALRCGFSIPIPVYLKSTSYTKRAWFTEKAVALAPMASIGAYFRW